MNKIELKRKLLAMGLEVTADNQVKKKDIKKALRAIAYSDTDEVWDKLRYVVPEIRQEIKKLIKELETNAGLKDKVKEDYGSGFIEDLGLIAKLYAKLKRN